MPARIRGELGDIIQAVGADFDEMPEVNNIAIVERGSTSDGSYIRLSDGTQICWGIRAYTISSGTTVGYGPEITLPAEFVGVPAFTFSVQNNSSRLEYVGLEPAQGAGFISTYIRNSSHVSDMTGYMYWSAFGHWF